MFNSAKRLRKELSQTKNNDDNQIRFILKDDENIRHWTVSEVISVTFIWIFYDDG